MRSSNPEALILPAMSVIASATASASARSIMRRSFVDRPLSGIAQGAQVFGQFRDHGFQLVDAAALLVNALIQYAKPSASGSRPRTFWYSCVTKVASLGFTPYIVSNSGWFMNSRDTWFRVVPLSMRQIQ